MRSIGRALHHCMLSSVVKRAAPIGVRQVSNLVIPILRAKLGPQPTVSDLYTNDAAIQQLMLHRKSRNVPKFITGLKALAVASKKLTSVQRDTQLSSLIRLMEESLSLAGEHSHFIDTMLWTIGSLGFQMSNPRHAVLILDCLRLLCQQPSLTGRGLSTGLDGLVLTGLTISQLTEAQSHSLMGALERTLPFANPRDLGSILRHLGKLGSSWATLPANIQQLIWRALERNMPLFNDPFHPALVVHSFGILALEAGSLNAVRRNQLLELAKRAMNVKVQDQTRVQICQQASMTMLGLGKMGFPYSSLPSDLATRIEHCLIALIPTMPAVGVSHVIYAMGLMGQRWAAVPNTLQVVLQKALLSELPQMRPQESFTSLYGMAQMGVQWSELMPELKSSACVAVNRVLCETHNRPDAPQHAAMAIYSMGLMGAQWMYLFSSFHSNINSAFVELHSRSTPQGIGSFLFGLGLMHAPIDEMSEPFLAAVQQSIDTMIVGLHTQAMTMALQGLAAMGVSCTSPLFPSLQAMLARMLDKMSSFEVSQTMQSLTAMEVGWQHLDLHTLSLLTEAIEARAASMSSPSLSSSMYFLAIMGFDCLHSADTQQALLLKRALFALAKCMPSINLLTCQVDQLSQFIVFFALLETIPDGKEMAAKYFPGGVTMPPQPSFLPITSTAAHLAVGERLSLLLTASDGLYRVANEFAGFSGAIDIDLAVFHKDQLVALIEVDGKAHYKANGTLKRADQLKGALYAHRYPEAVMYRVTNEQVRDNGAAAVAKKLADQILSHKNLASMTL